MLSIISKMVENISLLKNILQEATAYRSRSTVLNPLGWLVALTITSTISAYHFKIPHWICVTLAASGIASVFFYILAYVFLFFKDRDSLRSERYILTKKIIEREIAGDSIRELLRGAGAEIQLAEKSGSENIESGQ